jgi:hypothetical protein
MTVCNHTGVAIPECSCRACLESQIEQHMPTLLAGGGAAVAELPQTAEMPALSSRLRPGFLERFRRYRRIA